MPTALPDRKRPLIYWFRQDLRLCDLPALRAAASTGKPVLACYILDDESPGQWQPGGASRWWLHHSLTALAAEITSLGGYLYLERGSSAAVLARLAAATGASHIFCSRQYEPWAVALERSAQAVLSQDGVTLQRFSGTLLWEPEEVSNKQGAPYKVFTPFWRRCRELPHSVAPAGPCDIEAWYEPGPDITAAGALVEDWELLPREPDWAADWPSRWQPGERNALARLQEFLQGTLAAYEEGRDHPAGNGTSLLSPHLHCGEIAPARIYQETQKLLAARPGLEQAGARFLSELGWREFSNHLLYHFPTMPEQPFNARFERFAWLGRKRELRAWQQGVTGYPLVDAGMRELWQTGYMHNRVRMVVASFLCKHLLVDWRAGQRWFWDTLVDADLANNACSWQWVAGSGVDAAPYYRVFNPVAQGKKFDREGAYVRRWVPEIALLPDRYLHEPWSAPAQMLQECAVELGKTYPYPIVDHKQAREAALAAYAHTRL